MRAAVDTNALYTTRAGVARYVRGLLSGLRTVAAGTSWELDEFAWPVENFGFQQPWRALRTFYRELFWAPCLAPRLLRRNRFDLLHATGVPLFTPPPSVAHVVTVHDIGFLRFPERFRGWHRRMAIEGLRRTRSAQRVICISEFTARELIELAGFPPEQLRVVHNGCTFATTTPPASRPRLALPDTFFLFVGSLEPGKNLSLLRSTYELAQSRRIELPPLVIVGARFEGLAAEGTPPPHWHYLGHLPDPALVWLYQHALALAFPSKYEGFGLPIAEAMSLGCPVLCSPVSSLPEVAGDAALLAPQEPEAYLDALQRLATQPELRLDLSRRGRAQGALFTWERCARETLAVYEEAAPCPS
ncbi:MAG: glycosyltransferase family 4 protein [Verrucomicrobiales bacterium]|nr:glycosyltransferase family 4 protein [Verrucomicrobiales bacterium]